MGLNSQPFLRWAGSKRQLLAQLGFYWRTQHRRYLEPFVGSACLFFRLQPKRAVLGDINAELIFAYQQVKTNATGVAVSVRRYKKGVKEYYRLRAVSPLDLEPVDRAARFIYLNRFCFNGLYRTNRQGHFNVPYGGAKVGHLPTLEELETCQSVLRHTTLVTGDFAETLVLARSGDFVYMDPPYTTVSSRIFNEYDRAQFKHADLLRLRSWMDKLTQGGVVFVVSYANCSESKLLSRGYECRKVDVRRNIAGFASNRRVSSEVLITNRSLVTSD